MAEIDEDMQADVLGAPPQLSDDVWSRLISSAVEAEPDDSSAALLPQEFDADDAAASDEQFDTPHLDFTPDDDSDTQDDVAHHHLHDDPNHVDHDADGFDQ